MINRALFFALATMVVALGHSSVARAQSEGQFAVNPSLADQGAKIWKSKGCDGCHSIGKGKRAGPDLAGVMSRRPALWLQQWLKDPAEMAKSDSTAKQMVKEAQGTVMPNFRLTDQQIDGLLNYMAREDGKTE